MPTVRANVTLVVEMEPKELTLICRALRGQLREQDKATAEALCTILQDQKVNQMKDVASRVGHLERNLKPSA